MKRISVDLGDRSYEVLVGAGAIEALPSALPSGPKRAAIVTQPGIPVNVDPGIEHRMFPIGVGEGAKSLATVESLCRRWADWGLTRSDVVVAVGGGMVTDVAGLAAALYHRGVPVVHVATTLLAQVDAAIGGKAGVNLPEGKNLVGAFWQPSAVICDTHVLQSLPQREWRNGMGEVAKYHFLGEPHLDDFDLEEQVARCVALKAAVVATDERESASRATLNYGHTLAHALEIETRHRISHGEAVAIGLVFAAEMAHRLGRIDADRVAEHRRVVSGYGLPSRVPRDASAEALVTLMGRDKKRASEGLTFVLDNGERVELVQGVPYDLTLEVLVAMGAT